MFAVVLEDITQEDLAVLLVLGVEAKSVRGGQLTVMSFEVDHDEWSA